jgi:hypothetical protein
VTDELAWLLLGGNGVSRFAAFQARKMGVLDGAEKLDSQKGCMFSASVKYCIRKGMLALLAENSGDTLLPVRAPLSLSFWFGTEPIIDSECMHASAGKNREHHPQGEGGAARDPVQAGQGRNPSDSKVSGWCTNALARPSHSTRTARQVLYVPSISSTIVTCL